ncbi:translation initiation factor IF-2, partial [mine drainage metagenome]
DRFIVVDDERSARVVAEARRVRSRAEELRPESRTSLESLFQRIQEGELQDLNIILKGDVQGSVEALRSALERLTSDEVRVRVLHEGVGAINESDVMLAHASHAIVIGFNVRPDAMARRVADREQVDVRTYRVIYDALHEIEAAVLGMAKPEVR